MKKTLQSMATGGIHDQVGGGFHRYSTDRYWLVPHFEKMLYDNALLARVYLEAYQVTGEPAFLDTAVDTLEWMLREMTGPEGAFHSAQDADTPDGEGYYYTWTPAEIEEVLGKEDSGMIRRAVRGRPRRQLRGRTVDPPRHGFPREGSPPGSASTGGLRRRS